MMREKIGIPYEKFSQMATQTTFRPWLTLDWLYLTVYHDGIAVKIHHHGLMMNLIGPPMYRRHKGGKQHKSLSGWWVARARCRWPGSLEPDRVTVLIIRE